VFGNNGAYATFARTGKFIEHDGENTANGKANVKDMVRVQTCTRDIGSDA